MGLGILESTKLRSVPGTALLDDKFRVRSAPQDVDEKLKRTNDGIILVPQPSDDLDDPLNWPLWQRDLITFILCLLSLLGSTLSPLLAANTGYLLGWFQGISVTGAALLTGYNLLGVAVSGFVFVPLARVWGKRCLFVVSPLIIIVSTVWAGYVGHNYKSLYAARFFQGVGLAPLEGLVNVAVGEIYFVHESGKRMALSNLCLFGGAFFTPVIVGITTLKIGWEWVFWLLAIFTGAIFPFVYLYCPETTYVRAIPAGPATNELGVAYRMDSRAGSSQSPDALQPSSSSVKGNTKGSMSMIETEGSLAETIGSLHVAGSNIHRPVYRKLITRKSLALFSGRKTDESFIKLLLRPFALFLHPGVLWACLIQGAMIAWTSVLGVSLALILLERSFNEAETGYMYTGAFVGAMLAFGLAALISDPSVRLFTRLNRGVFEPEFRLFMVIPTALFGTAGLFGFGVVASDPKYGAVVIDVFFGFVIASLTLGCVAAAQYIVDAYRDITIEAFTCLLIFKNFLGYGMVAKSLDWLLKAGTKRMFFTLGYIQLAIYALTIPLYFYGKRNRSFLTRYDILRILHLR